MTQGPCVHLNGTGRESLMEQYSFARWRVMDAMRAIEAAGPNQRDYYPLGDEAWRRALHEHHARLIKLQLVEAELGEILNSLADQGGR